MPRDAADATDETEGLAHSLSPVDLPDPATPLPHGLRWTSIVIASATLVLLLLNAHAIRGWSYELPPNAASAPVVTVAESWFDIVDRAALNRPVETMHAWWQAAREMRFDDEEAPPRDDRAASIKRAAQDSIA